MKNLIPFLIIFILVNSIISHDEIDKRLLSIYIDENGEEQYEYPKNNDINNKIIISKEKHKYLFDKSTTKKEIASVMNSESAWKPCENLNCVHGHCFLMIERFADDWAYCECDKGYYGRKCQYGYGESLKVNLQSTFSIDVEKRTVLDKINDFFNYNVIPETIGEIYEVISFGKNLIDYYTNQNLSSEHFWRNIFKNSKRVIAINPIKEI